MVWIDGMKRKRLLEGIWSFIGELEIFERSREKTDKNRVVKLKKTMARLKAVFLKILLDLRFNRNLRDISFVAIIYFQIQ